MSRKITLFITLLLGFFIGILLKNVYEKNVFQAFAWDGDAPVILNCYGEALPESVVVRAIDYWTVRGFNIGFYEMNPSKEICEKDYIEGFIMIKSDGSLQNKDVLAQTRRHTRLTWMAAAVINLGPGTYNLDLLLEHELGHALGLGHIEVQGHIMHPLYTKMGPKFWIPK